MSHTMTLELPDEVYRVIQRTATMLDKTMEELVTEWLARYAPRPRPQLTAEERQAARERFEQLIGAWDSGDSNSADNERIDADLAREYGEDREGKA
ncbi:MAG: hypothetical protein A3F84_23750 [Candidatus Handelsmanbacteria bacterium RIFCSPLOWO2_12_FULL_64_10]|uniref:CopG family transcriptional regulator n=1 Tax=Handelsmanbacteria sp. (strain RIFCSPLOWO2_12_FULL_64_10) TaxID=1817868 RepID=A0A1F6CAN6_HANXR|nr:MAG: hypothetical protein A3F84_23750 [Candidatus Handelsmanbacteria bacterium RIFCSPLOWO2_12_FULL_64_10]